MHRPRHEHHHAEAAGEREERQGHDGQPEVADRVEARAHLDGVHVREAVLIEGSVALARVVVRQIDVAVELEALGDQQVVGLVRLRRLHRAVVRIDGHEERHGDHADEQGRAAVAERGQRRPEPPDREAGDARQAGEVQPRDAVVALARGERGDGVPNGSESGDEQGPEQWIAPPARPDAPQDGAQGEPTEDQPEGHEARGQALLDRSRLGPARQPGHGCSGQPGHDARDRGPERARATHRPHCHGPRARPPDSTVQNGQEERGSLSAAPLEVATRRTRR
jgi:hypothetical protein